MIDIKFKKCCEDCPEIDLTYDCDIVDMMGRKKAFTTIGCSHAKVCARYISENNNAVIADYDKFYEAVKEEMNHE